MIRATLVGAFTFTFAACGMGADAPDVAAYQQNVSELQTAIATHQTDAAATTTAQDCTAEHQRYDDMMRPLLQHLTSMSGSIDNCQQAMGHAGPFNMNGMCGSMQSELDRHAATACAGDPSTNHAEAAHHCQLMRDWLSQQQSQANSMMAMGGMMHGGRCSP